MSTFALGFSVRQTGMLCCGYARKDSAEMSLSHKLDHRYFNSSYAERSLGSRENIFAQEPKGNLRMTAELLMVVYKLQNGNQ